MSDKAPYTIEEVLNNFTALLCGMDYARELALLGVGRHRFLLRKRLTKEFKALTIGLWKLALERSFPADHKTIFDAFMLQYEERLSSPQKQHLFQQLVWDYIHMLEKRRESDFTEPGAHLVAMLRLTESEATPLRLRLALRIRSIYTLVFQRLV